MAPLGVVQGQGSRRCGTRTTGGCGSIAGGPAAAGGQPEAAEEGYGDGRPEQGTTTDIHADSWDLCCRNHSQQSEPVCLPSGFCRTAQSLLSETTQWFLEGIARDFLFLVVFLQPGPCPARHAMPETGIPNGDSCAKGDRSGLGREGRTSRMRKRCRPVKAGYKLPATTGSLRNAWGRGDQRENRLVQDALGSCRNGRCRRHWPWERDGWKQQ